MSPPGGGTGAKGLPGDQASGASAGRSVRFTLDLTRPQHRFLKQFALDVEADASNVMRALLRLLEEDEALAKRVVARLPSARTGPGES